MQGLTNRERVPTIGRGELLIILGRSGGRSELNLASLAGALRNISVCEARFSDPSPLLLIMIVEALSLILLIVVPFRST